MLLDLARALSVAVLVGVVPGWFWAGLLCATADRTERLAFSVAVSIALVPTAALMQARLFGVGVTPVITVVSVLLVLATGLAVYLRFGPAKESDEPLVSRPGSLHLLSPVPLIFASALVLAALSGILSMEPVAIPMALLVLAAGISHLAAATRGAVPLEPAHLPRDETSGLRESRIISTVRSVLLSTVLLLVLLRSYPGPLRYDWPFPRGVDKYGHAVMVSMMLSEGSTESFMLYPPGFHVLAAAISALSGLEPLKLFATIGPALLILPALGCYALARRLWGWQVGVAAAFFSGLIAGGSYQHVTHARYPNLIGVFLLILAVAALVRIYAWSSVRDQLTLAILGSSVVFYHMVASLYEAVLLGLVGMTILPYLILRERNRGLALLFSFSLLGVLSVLYAWDTYDLPSLAAGLLDGSGTGRGGEAVAMALGTKPTGEFARVLATTSLPVAWLGLLGALLAVGELLRRRIVTPQSLAYLTLLLWAVPMFIGSRTTLSSFPDRFERDMSIPLALLSALAFVTILQSWRARGGVVMAASLVALMTVTVVGVQAARNLEEAAGPAQRGIDRPPPPEVVAAGEWLREHNEGGKILSTPSVGPVSARGMLAMGGYSGMQTYSAHRIERGRDLPPSGAGPLWDALWALRHPDGERTRMILEENNVRYVVLGKHHREVSWRSFQAETNLYRLVFENDTAAIFERREDSAAD